MYALYPLTNNLFLASGSRKKDAYYTLDGVTFIPFASLPETAHVRQ